MRLHEWAFTLASRRERHGLSGGETNASTQAFEEGLRATGAVVNGQRASVVQQYLKAGLVDELRVNVAPCSWAEGSASSGSGSTPSSSRRLT
jgi:hypothetical protein